MVEWMNGKPKVWKKHRKGETKTVTFTVTEKETGSGSVGQLLSDFGKELKKKHVNILSHVSPVLDIEEPETNIGK